MNFHPIDGPSVDQAPFLPAMRQSLSVHRSCVKAADMTSIGMRYHDIFQNVSQGD